MLICRVGMAPRGRKGTRATRVIEMGEMVVFLSSLDNTDSSGHGNQGAVGGGFPATVISIFLEGWGSGSEVDCPACPRSV